MNRRNHIGFLAAASLSLALWACSGGSSPTADGGDGGDGGQAECTVAAQCDDGNPCTDDLCAGGKCVHNNNDDPCDDGQECSTGDHCANGVCVGETTLDCDDGNPCTEDTCSDDEGCVHFPNHAPL
ncbi:MAG: hypothetical protein D6806_13640 [Deltaproteobacteria bacterium]|nr:MAG: hypothetical protein D6806_13640 [Deltaproteobacteria bacterium]